MKTTTMKAKDRFAQWLGAVSPSLLLGSLTLLALILFLFTPSIAYADDGGAKQTALQNFTDQVFAILAPVLVALIGTLAAWILFKVKQKLHVDVGEQISIQWQDLAKQAALRGAEWARKKAKEAVGDTKIPGGEVMETAANWAIEMAVHQGLPELARNKLEGLIEAELFKLRLEQAATPAADPLAAIPQPKV